MHPLCCFTLALLLALPSRAEPPVQNDTARDQNEPSETQNDTPDPEAGDEPDRSHESEPTERAPEENDDDEAPASGAEEPDTLHLELETNTIASTRGETAIDALIHLSRGAWSGALGMGNGGSPETTQRQWLRAQLAAELFVTLAAQGLWQPPQGGSSQEQIRLSASGETGRGSWEIALQQEDAKLSAGAAGLVPARGKAGNPDSPALAMELSGGSISLEGAHAIAGESGLRARVQLGAGSYSLRLPRAAATPWGALAPWDRFGRYALAWPARASCEAGLSMGGKEGTASAAIGAGLPAQTGGLEAELLLAGERPFGPLTLSLQLGIARLWPGTLWLGSLTLGARWRISG
jgi:hypothetical protein